jgi:hypothetical protein
MVCSFQFELGGVDVVGLLEQGKLNPIALLHFNSGDRVVPPLMAAARLCGERGEVRGVGWFVQV